MKTSAFILALASGLGLTAAWADDHFVVEDQTPTYKYLTATEVRPILERTKRVWIGVREHEGQDWLYFTHLLEWRCGLHQMKYAINDGPLTVFPMKPCDPDNPETFPEDQEISVTYEKGAIETVTIDLLYDDLGTQTETYARGDILFK